MAYPYQLLDLSDACSQWGISEVVFCPGSRNAPLGLAFHRNPNLQVYSIIDERSAGFFALGLAQKSQKPVIICCTSGSALMNFGPAIVEAFFAEVPLIIISADRPASAIGHWEGQTIYQKGAFAQHVRGAAEFLPEMDLEHNLNQLRELIWASQAGPAGPVHLNVPIQEPFYPEKEEIFQFPKRSLPPLPQALKPSNLNHIRNTQWGGQRILISLGQLPHIPGFNEAVQQLMEQGVLVIGEALSNAANSLQNQELLLAKPQLDLPGFDWHLHIGMTMVSKNLRQWLRAHPAKHHAIITQVKRNPSPDPFQNHAQTWDLEPLECLKALLESIRENHINSDSYRAWTGASQALDQLRSRALSHQNTWVEYRALAQCFQHPLGSEWEVHLANSLSVRYPNWLPHAWQQAHFHGNRGVSGIDGCLSTALGHAQNAKKTLVLIGDLALHYDRNALWNQYVPQQNLLILVLNNQGGGIFRNLPGAKDLPEREFLIATAQHRKAAHMAQEAGLNYLALNAWEDLPNVHALLEAESFPSTVVELCSNGPESALALSQYMALFKS